MKHLVDSFWLMLAYSPAMLLSLETLLALVEKLDRAHLSSLPLLLQLCCLMPIVRQIIWAPILQQQLLALG